MEAYRTEEEQVEALKRWWDENGRSTIVAIIVAVSLSFAYQAWKGSNERKAEQASDLYQTMLQAVSGVSEDAVPAEQAVAIAEQLKADYDGSVYAQFAALHLARLAVENNDLAGAETQLRWVLGKADNGSDTARLAQLRLARVLAASGDVDQALSVLVSDGQDNYQAAYAVARGDILLAEGRSEEARAAYMQALSLAGANPGQVNMVTLQQKLQSLNPVPARELVAAAPAEEPVASDPAAQPAEDQ